MSLISIDDADNLRDIYPGDAITSLTLNSRGPGDAAATAYVYPEAVFKPITREQIKIGYAIAGKIQQNFLLWKSDNPAIIPKVLDSITDASGVVWQVTNVDIKSFGRVFMCLCVRNVQ